MTSVATTTAYDPNDGMQPQSSDKQYPRMPAEKGKRPLLQSFAATGTAVFSGIIDGSSTGEYNPDFFWRDAVLIYDQMRRSDGMIAGVIRAIEQPILSADWTIEPGVADNPLERKYGPPVQPAQPSPSQPPQMFADFGQPGQQGMPPQPGMPPMSMPPQQPPQPQQPPAPKPDAKAIEIAAFVQSNLLEEMCYTTASGQTLYQSWQEVLRHSLLHLWYGFMTFEKVWKVEDGFVKIARLTPMLPRTLYRWWVDSSTELVGIQQYVWKDYGYRYINIPVSKVVRLANQQEGNGYEGISLLRPIFKHWQFVEGFERIQAIGIERDAVNFPFINVPSTASDAEIQAAQTIVENIRANESMGGTTPPGFEVYFPANHQPFTEAVQSAIESHHESIARSVLANFMNQGTTKYGGKSTDESQGTRFLQALQHVCNYLIEQFNQQVIRPLVDYNYDDVEVYPKLHCTKLSLQDVQSLAGLIQSLNAGNSPMLHATPEDESFIRDLIGMPSAPTNPVEATNPASPANSMQPDAGANPDAGTDANMPNTNVSPSANSASQAAAGDAGDGLSELHESVLLLRETMQAVLGVDAVERGLDHEAAVRLYNPYHRGGGGGGGQFTRKATAGASMPSAGRSSGGSSSTRGRATGKSGASEHESRSGAHGGAGRSGGGGGSSHGSGSRGKAAGEHASSGRKSRASKSEGESTPHASRGSRAKGEGETTTKTARATFKTPGNVPTTRAQASRAHVQWNTQRYGHVTEAQGAAERAKGMAKSDPRKALLTQLHDEHIDATRATTHAELASTRLLGPGHARAVEEYTAAQHHYAEVTARIATLKAQIAAHDSGTSTTHASRSRGAKSTAKGEGESIHQRSARLQSEGHLPHEVNPRSITDEHGLVRTTPIARVEGVRADPFHVHPDEIVKIYGEHQLAANLHNYTHDTLKEYAKANGITPGHSRAETISRITSKVTEGRYSGNFGKGKSAGERAPTTRSKAAKSDEEPTGKSGSKASKEPDYLKGANEREAAARASTPGASHNPTSGGIHTINIATPADPRVIASRLGNENLAENLGKFSHGALKNSAELVGVKPGANKEETIARILHRVTGERPATTHAAKGATTKGSTRSKAAKSDEATNGGHHVMTDAERHAAGLKAEVNPHTLPKNSVGHSELTPEHTDVNHQVTAGRTTDPHWVAATYGEHQVGAALSNFSRGSLVQVAKNEGLKANGTKEDLVARITQHVTQGRYSGRFPKGEATGKGSTTKGSTRSKSSTDNEIAKLEARLATLKAGRSGEGTGSKGGTSRGSRSSGTGSKSSGGSKAYTKWKSDYETVVRAYKSARDTGQSADKRSEISYKIHSLRLSHPKYAAQYDQENPIGGGQP